MDLKDIFWGLGRDWSVSGQGYAFFCWEWGDEIYFHKTKGISFLTEKMLLTSQGLWSMDLFSDSGKQLAIRKYHCSIQPQWNLLSHELKLHQFIQEADNELGWKSARPYSGAVIILTVYKLLNSDSQLWSPKGKRMYFKVKCVLTCIKLDKYFYHHLNAKK